MIVLVSACSSTVEYSPENVEVFEPFKDNLFPTYANYSIESSEEVFSLSDEALAYIKYRVNVKENPRERIDALIEDLFSNTDFKLSYVSSANTNAAETFKNRSANCLSMSIMAYSLAEKANLEVHFQEVDIPEYWTNREGYSLLNGHINLRISPDLLGNTIYFNRSWTTVDFDPLSRRSRFRQNSIRKNRVLAMYYNNKGADAFLRGNYDRAYAYFKASATAAPNFDDVWVNLGYLYKVRGDLKAARATYEHAIALDDDNYTGWENLAILLASIGREKEAKDIQARIERKRLENPYYHLMLGDQEFKQENWRQAIKYYRRAIKLDDRPHEFYYGLAKTYFKLGDVKRSVEFLRQARKNSELDQDKEHYQRQLDLFTSL